MNLSIKKRKGSPDFVLGSGGVKYEDLADYMNEKGYINFDLLKGKEGGYYIKISDYGINKEKKESNNSNNAEEEIIPF